MNSPLPASFSLESQRDIGNVLALEQQVIRILCVDDEPNILSSVRRLLRPHGYQVVVANSGRE